MLKFFRKYNKWLLAVGGSILMVAFLLPTMQGMGGPSGPQDYAIGTIDGEDVMNSQRQAALQDMEVLMLLSNGLLPVPAMENNRNEPDPIVWMLVLHDAVENMGLHVSDQQVLELRNSLMPDETVLATILQRGRYRLADADRALRNWLLFKRYQDMVLGVSYISMADRYDMINNFLNSVPEQFRGQFMAYVMQEAMNTPGNARASRPLIEHVLNDQNAGVQLEVVRVDAEHYLDKTPTPSEDDIKALFDQYKDKLEGQGEDYGFGYRIPDRVKLEYLILPFDQLRETVRRTKRVRPEHTLAYYEKNQAAFVEYPEPGEVGPDGEQPKPADPRLKPYLEVQHEIEKLLVEEEAEKLGDEIVKAAMLILNDDARTLRTDEDGYKVIDAFEPMSLNDLADRLEKQLSIRPQIVRRDDQWYDTKALRDLPEGISDSVLPTQGNAPIAFIDYVLSTHEIAGAAAPGPLTSLRLQAKLPSQPMINSATGDRFLFRLIEAEKNHVPASLDEVREAVTRDAHRLAAYRKMLEDRAAFEDELRLNSIADLGEKYGETFSPAPFTKRVASNFGTPVAPEVPPIGRNEKFVDAVFELVSDIMASGGLGSATPEQAEGVIGLDDQQALLLVRVLRIDPMTHGQFERLVGNPSGALAYVLQAMDSGEEAVASPLSRKVLMQRTGYQPFFGTDGSEDATAETGARTASNM